jgi:YHS domain-containing protein/thiol-disulfide isomerase/thioredoxin
MRFVVYTLCAGLIVVSLACQLIVRANETRSEAWHHDFELAESEAKQQGLPMLVHFHAKWCGPCKQMDREVLHDPVLLKQLRTGFVAVKVDSDERPDLRKRFRIEKLPSDVFLDPRGYVLDRSSGIHDRKSYLSLVARIDAMYAQSRTTRIASQTKPLMTDMMRDSSQATESQRTLRPVPPPIAPNPVGPGTTDPVPIAASISTQPLWEINPPGSQRRWMSLGMKGFSPVTLVNHRKWQRGEQQFAADYKGIVYFLASTEELRQFKESPERYAPQILGCDPVILDVADRAVPGDIRYAAFFDGELYLFVSDKSRETFRQDPRRFVRTKHVLKVDELDEKCLE